MIYLLDSGVEPSLNFCTENFSTCGHYTDVIGHGSSMASIIKSIHPDAKISNVKIGDSKPNLLNIKKCLEYLESKELFEDINIILFNANFPYETLLDEFEAKLRTLSNKFIIVVPAGNNSTDVTSYTPARCNFVWNVGSLNKSNKPTQVTNFGNESRAIDFWIVSTNTNAISKDNKKIRVFGTSVAASILAALIDKHQIIDKIILEKVVNNYNESVSIN